MIETQYTRNPLSMTEEMQRLGIAPYPNIPVNVAGICCVNNPDYVFSFIETKIACDLICQYSIRVAIESIGPVKSFCSTNSLAYTQPLDTSILDKYPHEYWYDDVAGGTFQGKEITEDEFHGFSYDANQKLFLKEKSQISEKSFLNLWVHPLGYGYPLIDVEGIDNLRSSYIEICDFMLIENNSEIREWDSPYIQNISNFFHRGILGLGTQIYTCFAPDKRLLTGIIVTEWD